MRVLFRHPIAIVFGLGIAALVYLLIAKLQYSSDAGNPTSSVRQAPIVVVESVVTQSIADQVESVGTAIANESVNLTAKVSDTISKVHFEDGQFTQKGDVLLELTNSSEASRLAEAQASANEAKRQYERLKNLVASNLVATTDLDQARANMETSKARLNGVIVAMNERLVRAPFDGLLGFRGVSEGSLLSPNTAITTLDDISEIKLEFTIPEVYLADVAVGQTIAAKSIVYPDRVFNGVIRVIGSRIDPVTRSVPIRARIPNPDATLRPGMLLTVSLKLNEAQAILVPELAVTITEGEQKVFVLGPQNVVQQTEVVLGRRRPGQVEVLSGLSPGQRVVTEGIARLRSGQTVRVRGEAESPAASILEPDTP